MLDLRAAERHLVSGHKDREGVLLKQNGYWDDRVLCDVHEKMIGAADDYGVRFCRAFREARDLVRNLLKVVIGHPRDLSPGFLMSTFHPKLTLAMKSDRVKFHHA